MSLIKNTITIITLIMIVLSIPYVLNGDNPLTFLEESTEKTNIIASDNTGYVTKDVYNPDINNKTIILITGIHPREVLAINPEIESAKKFASDYNDVKIINYNVTVTQNKEDYKKSRYNGEHLVANYILPDINQSKANAIIISHSHIPGYGEGFYLATPTMDLPSIAIAERVNHSNIDFNYFKTEKNITFESTSIELVTKPLEDSGYPTVVYEIPENITEQESTDKTYELIKVIYEFISST